MSNPTTLVSAFDGDLSFADQSGSGTWAGVDPIRYDDGLWLEEGATSHIENPIGGNGATGYSGNFIEVVSLPGPLPYDYLSGVTQCSRVTATGDRGAYGGIVTTVAFEVPDTSEYTISALIWVPSSYGGTGIRLTHQNFSGAAATEAVADMGKRDQWQRIGPVHLDIDADRAGNVTLQNLSGTWLTGQTLYFVFMQTTKGGYATSPIAGSLGPGFSWSGTPHGAFIASIRAASSASVATAGHIDSTEGGIAIKAFRRKIDTASTEVLMEVGTSGSGTDRLRLYINSSDKLVMEWVSDGATATTLTTAASIAVNTDYFIYADWKDTLVRLRLDTVMATGTRNAPEGSWGAGALTLKAA